MVCIHVSAEGDLHVINDLLLSVKVDAFTEIVKVASVVVVNMNLVW